MKRLTLILCFILVLVFSASCSTNGTGSKTGGNPGGTNSGPTAGNGTEAGAAKKTTFTAGFSADVTTIDPYDALNAATIAFREMIFDSLIFRGNNGYENQLCTSYTPNEDGTEWTVKIRDDVYFQNGKPMTSADCIATFQYIKDNVGVLMVPTYTYGTKLDSFRAVDDYTFVITFKSTVPEASIKDWFSYTPVLCTSAIPAKGAAWSADNMVGSGPWVYKEWVQGQYVHAARNDDYWDKNYTTTVKDIYVRYIAEESTRVSALVNGELDYVPGVSNDHISLLVNSSDLTITTKNSLTMCYANLSFKDGSPCNDINFRLALTHCINRQGICDQLLGGGTALASAVSKSNTAHYVDLAVPKFDLEAAKEYLGKSTYKGEKIKIIVDGQLLNAQEMILQIMADMQSIGINAEFKVLTSAEMTEVRNAGDYTIAFGYRGMGNDPGSLYTSEIVDDTHGSGFKDDELKELSQLASSTIDSEERTGILKRIQQITYDKAAPLLFLFEYQANFVVRSDFKGIIYSLDGGYCLKYLINS